MSNNKTGLLPVQQLSQPPRSKSVNSKPYSLTDECVCIHRFCHVPVCYVANNYSKSELAKGELELGFHQLRGRERRSRRRRIFVQTSPSSFLLRWRRRRRRSLASPFLFLESPSVTNPQTLPLRSSSDPTRDSDPSLSPPPPQLLPTVSATMASPSTTSHSIPILDHPRFSSFFLTSFFEA